MNNFFDIPLWKRLYIVTVTICKKNIIVKVTVFKNYPVVTVTIFEDHLIVTKSVSRAKPNIFPFPVFLPASFQNSFMSPGDTEKATLQYSKLGLKEF